MLHVFEKKTQKTSKREIRSGGNVTERRKSIERAGHKRKEARINRGRDNVFEDLGFESGEAVNLKVGDDLMLDLRQHIQERGWTQAEAAAFFRETQPRISNLLKGEISRFGIDKLTNMLSRAGLEVRVETKSKAA